ncbi:GNAT family N-acetyltransferase [Planococcus sp. APC 4015]|nr:GNAT family N-acetyltransferase [Planococcus sp. APC 4015]
MPALDDLLDEIRAVALGATVPGIRLIGIDGPAASGKSTIAHHLSDRFGWPIIQIDDFFSWVSFTSWWPRFETEVLHPLLDGRSIHYQMRDWTGDEFGEGLAGFTDLDWAPVVILEGVGSTRAAIAASLACRVWVDAPASVRLRRGVTRDGETHRELWEKYLPREADFFAADGTARRADIRVDGASPGIAPLVTDIGMADARTPGDEFVLETTRLRLRRLTVSDAAMQRRLWEERDLRVPPHRRISGDGRPTVEELEDAIRRSGNEPAPGLLAVVRTDTGVVVGYCGLIANAHGEDDEPELAYEFLRQEWGHGFATEAASAVVACAESLGHARLWATIRVWNTASRRVISKLGFVQTSRVEPDADHGDTLFYSKTLRAGG